MEGSKLLIIPVLLLICLSSSVFAIEPIVVRVVSANPATRTYTFACVQTPSGNGLVGNGVRNWYVYPEDTNQNELTTTLPANQTLTYTFNRTAYYNVACIVPNPPGLNYSSNYRHDLHIDLSASLGNPAVIPLSVAPGQITEACLYNGTNYTISWFLSTYAFAGGGVTVRYPLNATSKTLTFTPPTTPGLFDTHCLIHLNNAGVDIDVPWGVDFQNNSTAPYVADAQGIDLNNNYAAFNYAAWIIAHNNAQSNGSTNTTPVALNYTLSIYSVPAGNITLNTTAYGTTPLIISLPQGAYFLNVSAPGFMPNTTAISLNNNITLNLQLQQISNQTTNQSNTSNQTNTTTNTTATCFNSLQFLPANCTGGIISQDAYNGCRTIVCTNAANNMQILACDKPTSINPVNFEMYKQSQTGAVVSQICIGNTCISNNGFTISSNYPICINQTGGQIANNTINNFTLTILSTPNGNLSINGTSTGATPQTIALQQGNYIINVSAPGFNSNITMITLNANATLNLILQKNNNATIGTNSTNSTGNNTTQACYSSMATILASCPGGTLSADSIGTDGGRITTCANAQGTITAKTYNKPGDYQPTYFEIYMQNATGISQPNLCIGTTCLNGNGFAVSNMFPICINGTGNQTSGNQTNQTSGTQSLSLMIAPGFPDITTYGFICIPNNFTPIGYDWDFGDNNSLNNTISNNAFHAYTGSGNFVVKCTATNTSINTTLRINVSNTAGGNNISVNTNPNNQPPLPPTWLEPGATGVYPNDFHLHTNNAVDAENDTIISSDFEIWDVPANQLVWYSYKETVDPYHIHRLDGTFTGNLAGQTILLYNHTYEVRARFYENALFNNVSNWSSWHVFQTIPVINITTTTFSWTPAPGYEIQKVASNISLPVNVVMAPNLYSTLALNKQPLLYISQLYGQIGVLLNDGTYEQYAGNLLGTPPPGGIPGGGEAGVDGIYVDSVSGDVYASMSYTDNTSITGMSAKIVHFKTNASGDGFTNSNIIIDKIPVRPSHEAHTILKGADGKLYLSVGDADQLSWPQDPTKFNGKVLRMNWDGSMPSDNPFPGTYTYALGFRNPFGMAFRPNSPTNELYVSNNGQDTDDGLYKTLSGSKFGWPNSLTQGVWYGWPIEIAPTQVAFDSFDAFPNDTNNVYVVGSGSTYLQGPSPNSKRIFKIPINSDGTPGNQTPIATYTGTGFGDPIGLAFAPDGAYFTDIYGDAGFTGAGATQGNIYKIIWTGQNATNQTNQTVLPPSGFSAMIAQHPWYPQGFNMIWDCKASGGSGNFTYDYAFGDGALQLNYNQNNVWHTYSAHGTYNASCTVHDLISLNQTSGSTSITI